MDFFLILYNLERCVTSNCTCSHLSPCAISEQNLACVMTSFVTIGLASCGTSCAASVNEKQTSTE